jgi:hypothetical protein
MFCLQNFQKFHESRNNREIQEFLFVLKVVTMRKKGAGKLTNDRYWSRTVVIDVCFSFYLAAILD